MNDYLADMAYQGAEDSAHRTSERLQDAGMECHEVGWEDAANYFSAAASEAFRKTAYRLDADHDHYSVDKVFGRFLRGAPVSHR